MDVQAAVEQACHDFKDPCKAAAAEQVLLQFRQSPQPLPACRHLLEHSLSLEARFHAACTLREALVRDWALLGPEELMGLRSYLLHYTIIRCTSPAEPAAAPGHAASAVRSMLTATLAVLVKRGWLDAEGRPDVAGDTAFFQEMQALVAASGSAAAQRISMEVLQALVVEFNITSASPLGLPWDYHDKACRDMEERYLQGFFQHAVVLGRQAATSGAALRGEDGGSGCASLSLMASILGWDFQHSGNLRVNLLQAQASQKRGEVLSVAPGQSWTLLLLAPETCNWLVDLLAALAPLAQQQRAQPQQQALAAAARQLLVAFCSLSGEVLPRRLKPTQRAMEAAGAGQEAQVLRTGYLRQMLRALILWTAPVEAAVQHARKVDEGQLMDACRCICALTSNHCALVLEDASRGLLHGVPGGCLVQLLEQLTLTLVAAGAVSACDEEPWLHECMDMMLEAWSALLQLEPMSLAMSPAGNGNGVVPRPQLAAAQAATVFRAITEAALKDAAAGAHEDADDADERAGAAAADDWMVRAAALARAAPAANFSLLCEALKGTQAQLFECTSRGSDPSEVLEQLVWLLSMSAHALADSGAGETPLMPLALLEEAEAGGPGAEALQALCEALLAVPALALVDGARPALSPRLMECCIQALSRWADTYLLPEEPLPGSLHQRYGSPSGPALQLLDGVVRVALVCLVGYPGEAQLHGQVAGLLLPVLVRRRSLCRQLVALGPWQELAGAFASRQPGLVGQMSQRLHRSLAQSLGLAAAGLMGPKPSQAYVTQLMQPTAAELAALASRPDLDAAAGQAHTVHTVCCLLETLRGSTRATLSATQPAVYALTLPLLQPLLRLQHAFRGHGMVITLLLKLAAEMVENHVSFLRPAESDQLLHWVLELLQQYSRDNRWTRSLATARSLQEDLQVEQARDLQALMKLLSHVTQRDVAELDLQRQQQQQGMQQQQHPQLDAAHVVLLGLNIILPLLSFELLKFPKLCHLYFTLLSYILEVYTAQVAELAPAPFATLMQSLEFGLQHSDPLVAQAALEGLAGMARYQHKAQQQGLPAFTHQVGAGRSVAAHFLELLLRRLMLEDLALDLVELAADALLPLLLCEGGEYQRLCAALTASHADPRLAARVAQALSQLHPAGQQQGAVQQQDVNRHTKRAFRQNLCSVVSQIRGLRMR